MRVPCAAVTAALLLPIAANAGGLLPGPTPSGQTPSGQTPSETPASQAAPGQVPSPSAAGSPPSRMFTAPEGLLFNAVRPDRVADFEKVIAYVQAALENSTDATIRAQAKGWRVLKAAEPGPNGTVLYVFEFNPTVPGADYGLGRILADAYPDPAQLQDIWRLYQGAVTSGGSLLNLTPVAPTPPVPLGAPTPGQTPATPQP